MATASRRQFSPRPSHPPLPCSHSLITALNAHVGSRTAASTACAAMQFNSSLYSVDQAMIRATFRRWRLLNGQLQMYVHEVYHAQCCGHTRVSRTCSHLPNTGSNGQYHLHTSSPGQKPCTSYSGASYTHDIGPTTSRALATVASLPPHSSCLLTPALCLVSPAGQKQPRGYLPY